MSDAVQVAFSPTGVWLSAADGPTQIDSKTAAIQTTVPMTEVASNYAAGIAVLDSVVYVAYYDTGQLQTIQAP